MPGALIGPVNGFTDRSKGRGVVSSSWLQQIGNSTAQAANAGNISVITSGAGINPGSTGNDNVLAAWMIPANLFKSAGVGLQITVMGSVANNTNNKRIKIIAGATTAVVASAVVGGVTIADTGTYATTGQAGFQICAQIFKYGAGGSNTQIALHQNALIGSMNGALLPPAILTLTESASFLMAVTDNATTTTTDIFLNWAEIFATN